MNGTTTRDLGRAHTEEAPMENLDMDGIKVETHKLGEQLTEGLGKAKVRLSGAGKQVLEFIKEHPAACLLGAVAAGFVVGKLVSRNGK